MKRIYLFCSAGMSTSLVASRMQYGNADGERILKRAIQLLKSKKEQ